MGIVKRIESHGHKAYIVGGFVRDYLLGRSTRDLDIATSATPEEIASIFDIPCEEAYGSVSFKSGEFDVDVTTFRREEKYSKRRPLEVEYVGDVEIDLARRDFTMNAICIDSHGDIYDPLQGVKDLHDGIVRVIGGVEEKFRDDPLRIMRALRLAIVYGFDIEKEAFEYMSDNKELLLDISYDRKRWELEKILTSPNAQRGLEYLKICGFLDVLEITLGVEFVNTSDVIGAWAELEFSSKYPFTKAERKRIENIRRVLLRGKVDKEILFEVGLADALVAGDILGMEREEIIALDEELTIHAEADLAIDGDTIKSLLKKNDGPIIKEVKKRLLSEVISGNLPNSGYELERYIEKNWK